jgi:hypothetical protein
MEAVRPWCDKLEIEPIVVKDLRRYFCTRLCEAGVPEQRSAHPEGPVKTRHTQIGNPPKTTYSKHNLMAYGAGGWRFESS